MEKMRHKKLSNLHKISKLVSGVARSIPGQFGSRICGLNPSALFSENLKGSSLLQMLFKKLVPFVCSFRFIGKVSRKHILPTYPDSHPPISSIINILH